MPSLEIEYKFGRRYSLRPAEYGGYETNTSDGRGASKRSIAVRGNSLQRTFAMDFAMEVEKDKWKKRSEVTQPLLLAGFTLI